MGKQVKLTENELRQLIRESVHASLNEAGLDTLRNFGNRIKNAFSRKQKGNGDETNQPVGEFSPGAQERYDRGESIFPDESRNETPYSYIKEPSQTITPNAVNVDDWNEENYGNNDEEGESNGLSNQDEQPQSVAQSQATEHPQQSAQPEQQLQQLQQQQQQQ